MDERQTVAERAVDPETEAWQADLDELRKAATERQRFAPGTPEWRVRLRYEESVIARIRGWDYGERHGS